MEADRSADGATAAGASGWCVSTASTPRRAGTDRGSSARSHRDARRSPRRPRSPPAGEHGADRGTVGHLVEQWAASRVDVTAKTRAQYEWAAGHIERDLGAIRVDRLDRADVARWLDDLAAGGELSRRSILILRMVLRAALNDAVENGDLRRNPAARVGMPRQVARPDRQVVDEGVDRGAGHDVPHLDRRAPVGGADPAERALRPASQRAARAALVRRRPRAGTPCASNGRSSRSTAVPSGPTARTPAPGGRSPSTRRWPRRCRAHRRFQAEERLAAGSEWVDNDLVVATRTGTPVSPGNFDQTLERLVANAGVPRLTSHGLRHTAATHMVRHADDIGEIRAAADLLGHSPDILMRTYAHALPESVRTVTDKIGRRAAESHRGRSRVSGVS